RAFSSRAQARRDHARPSHRRRATNPPGFSFRTSMLISRLARVSPALMLAAPLAAASLQQPQVDPLRFFQGRTETVGTVKVMFHKAYRTRSVGAGRIEPDGSLTLVQRVEEEGKPPHDRRWRVRQTGPDR